MRVESADNSLTVSVRLAPNRTNRAITSKKAPADPLDLHGLGIFLR